MKATTKVLAVLALVSGCSGVHTLPPDGGGDGGADACREVFGWQVNAGGALGFDRADWPCPVAAHSADRAEVEACLDFLRYTATSECEVETCAPCEVAP